MVQSHRLHSLQMKGQCQGQDVCMLSVTDLNFRLFQRSRKLYFEPSFVDIDVRVRFMTFQTNVSQIGWHRSLVGIGRKIKKRDDLNILKLCLKIYNWRSVFKHKNENNIIICPVMLAQIWKLDLTKKERNKLFLRRIMWRTKWLVLDNGEWNGHMENQ